LGNEDGLTKPDSDLPFKELTLWRVFDCLVDGCSALTFKQELDVYRRGQALPPARPSAEVVVHFDLKPANSEQLCLKARSPSLTAQFSWEKQTENTPEVLSSRYVQLP
tara:strand:- start:636 stop:959 length:324 start_codon:yes stop_codon:yes gene_type:complete